MSVTLVRFRSISDGLVASTWTPAIAAPLTFFTDPAMAPWADAVAGATNIKKASPAALEMRIGLKDMEVLPVNSGRSRSYWRGWPAVIFSGHGQQALPSPAAFVCRCFAASGGRACRGLRPIAPRHAGAGLAVVPGPRHQRARPP